MKKALIALCAVIVTGCEVPGTSSSKTASDTTVNGDVTMVTVNGDGNTTQVGNSAEAEGQDSSSSVKALEIPPESRARYVAWQEEHYGNVTDDGSTGAP